VAGKLPASPAKAAEMTANPVKRTASIGKKECFISTPFTTRALVSL
jgi:hypothetical protein